MSDPQDDIRRWMKDELANAGRGSKGRLAKHLGVRPDAITRMLNTEPGKEQRRVEAHELLLMREFFKQSDDHPRDVGMNIPLMGFLGGGAIIEPDYEQVPLDGLEQVWVPFEVPDDLIAFEVRGSSMLPQFRDGTIIIVYREQRRALESFYGEEAAVLTEDGRRFIKTIMRGSEDGSLVTLTSWNAEPIERVRLTWIGELFSVFPRATLRRVAKQGGIQGRLHMKAGE